VFELRANGAPSRFAGHIENLLPKKRAGPKPRSKNCVDPVSPKISDLLLLDGVTLLVRAGLLPRLGPPDFNLSASLNPHWYPTLFGLSPFSATIVQNSSDLRNE
jgi:hypothetical protein